jgi:three-Cys-motif partner protein
MSSVVGEWAKDKLDRLRKYLSAYTTIMSAPKQAAWCRGFHFVDAFAGPGQHQIRPTATPDDLESLFNDATRFQNQSQDASELIAGSPLTALSIAPPFSTYTFIELDADRVASLKKLASTVQSPVEIVQSECAHFLRQRFVRAHNWKNERAVVFLDPFGMQVNWDTIEALASTKAIEIFLNFPVGMAIQRLLLRNADDYTEQGRQKLDGYFGTTEWFDVLYKKRRSLFGDVEDKVNDSGEALLRWYRKRLENVFGYVSSAHLIRNSRRGHLYYLLLASPNKTGAKIASYILSAGEKIKD